MTNEYINNELEENRGNEINIWEQISHLRFFLHLTFVHNRAALL